MGSSLRLVGMRIVRWAASLCVVVCASAAPAQSSWTSQLDHGSLQGFPTLKEAHALLDSWLERYPKLLSREQIGKSYQGRPIYAYVAGFREGNSIGRLPEVLITSLIHAREPAGLTVLLYFLGHLLELYAQGDPEAIYVLQTRSLHLIPIVNPDGYIANERSVEKMIRKNQRPTCIRNPAQGGIDLNRNFAFHWQAQFDPCNEEYQGAKPFSEPETLALKGLIEAHNFKTACNFHTFGRMLTHPYNFGKKALPADDQAIYDEIFKVFRWKKFGTAIQTVGYTASGESDDWMYAAHHIISMSPEVGPESGNFWPSTSLVAGIDERNYPRTLYVAKKAGFELDAVWSQSPASLVTASLPATALSTVQHVGALSASVLQLRLYNRGLSSSVGDGVHVAISGATNTLAKNSIADGFAVLQGEGPQAVRMPARLVPGIVGSSPASVLAFQVSPLLRRSSVTLLVILSQRLASSALAKDMKLCVAEMPKGSQPAGYQAVCQCLQQVPAAPPAITSAASTISFARPDTSDELGKLCAAAVAPVLGPLPTSSSQRWSKLFEVAWTTGPSGVGSGAVLFFSLSGIAAYAVVHALRRRRRPVSVFLLASDSDGERTALQPSRDDDIDLNDV